MNSKWINGYQFVKWGLEEDYHINNFFHLTLSEKESFLNYTLFTPKYLQEKSLQILANYTVDIKNNNSINAQLYYPENKLKGSVKIMFTNFTNINGLINSSYYSTNFSNIGCKFIFLTNE